MSRDSEAGLPLVGAQAANDIMTKTDERDGNVGKERKKDVKFASPTIWWWEEENFFLQ